MIKKIISWLAHFRFLVRNFNELRNQVAELNSQHHELSKDLHRLNATNSRLQNEVGEAKEHLATLVEKEMLELKSSISAIDVVSKSVEQHQTMIKTNMSLTYESLKTNMSLTYESLKVIDEVLKNLNELNRFVGKHHGGLNTIVIGKPSGSTDVEDNH